MEDEDEHRFPWCRHSITLHVIITFISDDGAFGSLGGDGKDNDGHKEGKDALESSHFG